jgi:hypothetical protein
MAAASASWAVSKELGQIGREQAGGIVGAGDADAPLDRDQPAAGHDPAVSAERLPLAVDAKLVLVGKDHFELEARAAEQRGHADQPAEDVLDPSAAR